MVFVRNGLCLLQLCWIANRLCSHKYEIKALKKQVSEKDEVIDMPARQSKKSLGILSKP